MRRPGVVVGAVFLLALLFSLGAFAADPARIGQAEAFVELPEDRPRRVQLEDGRLRMVSVPGTVFYFPIVNAQRAEDLSGVRAAISWNKGEELAARPRIEYRQMYDEAGGALGYRYVVVLAPADTSASGTMQGEVRVARRQSGEVPSVPFTVSLQSKEQEGVDNLFRCNSRNIWIDFSGSAEWATLDFYGEVRFVVSTAGQPPLNVGCSVEPLTDFVERYPDARLRFFCWPAAPIFNHTGALTLFAGEEEHLYRIIPGGLIDCTGSYSAERGGFVLQTRTLGEFVISSIPLDPQAPHPAPDNPPVGVRL